MTVQATKQDDDIGKASPNDPHPLSEKTQDASNDDYDFDLEQGNSSPNMDKGTYKKITKSESDQKMNANTAGDASSMETDHGDDDDHLITPNSTTKNNEKDDNILPPNGKYFAYIALVALFVDLISTIPYIPAIKRIGFRHYKWNGNPVATIYDSEQNSAQLDPELSARRALNVHVLAGYSLVIIAIFQITFTFFFHKKQQTENDNNEKNYINIMSPTSWWKFRLSETIARTLHRFVGRTAAVLWAMIYCTRDSIFF